MRKVSNGEFPPWFPDFCKPFVTVVLRIYELIRGSRNGDEARAMNPWLYLWLLNLILIIDWAKNKRPTFWLVALIFFGPLASVAYVTYFYEQINFPIELAKSIRKLTGKKVERSCPRCGLVGELKAHQDGRQLHFMCERCIDLTYKEPVRVSEVLEAASQILKERQQTQAEDSGAVKLEIKTETILPRLSPPETDAEFRLWGKGLHRLKLPKNVGNALKVVLQTERLYGSEQDRFPCLSDLQFLISDDDFATNLEDDDFEELFLFSQQVLGSKVFSEAWEDFWGPQEMAQHLSMVDPISMKDWMRSQIAREVGEGREVVKTARSERGVSGTRRKS